jgi:hypothetical protein
MAIDPDDPRLANLKPGNKRGPNKTTMALKEAILAAAEEHGEDDAGSGGLKGYLRKVAREDVKAFSGLLGKVLPMQVTGEGGGPLVMQVLTGVPRSED